MGDLFIMGKRRIFKDDFKKEIVETVLSGNMSGAQLSRKYSISPILISNWGKAYLNGELFEFSSPEDITRLKLKIKELEWLVRELTIKSRFLKKPEIPFEQTMKDLLNYWREMV